MGCANTGGGATAGAISGAQVCLGAGTEEMRGLGGFIQLQKIRKHKNKAIQQCRFIFILFLVKYPGPWVGSAFTLCVSFFDTSRACSEVIHCSLVTHFKNNGILELAQLAQPPFTDVNDHGIFGLFEDEDQDRIIRIVEQVNNNAVG